MLATSCCLWTISLGTLTFTFLNESLRPYPAFSSLRLLSTINTLPPLVRCVLIGGEYLSAEFTTYLKAHGIHRHLAAARTPEQNGVAERKNRTLIKAVRSIAADTKIPAFLWEEIFRAANYLQNCTSTKALTRSTPFEKLRQVKPDLRDLRVIGSAAHVWIPPPMRNKLATKSIETLLVGYDDQSKAYRCYCPSDGKIYVSRNVYFNENVGHSTALPNPSPSLDAEFFQGIPLVDHSTSTFVQPIATPEAPSIVQPSETSGPSDTPQDIADPVPDHSE